jgi:hypothetical protein
MNTSIHFTVIHFTVIHFTVIHFTVPSTASWDDHNIPFTNDYSTHPKLPRATGN